MRDGTPENIGLVRCVAHQPAVTMATAMAFAGKGSDVDRPIADNYGSIGLDTHDKASGTFDALDGAGQ